MNKARLGIPEDQPGDKLDYIIIVIVISVAVLVLSYFLGVKNSDNIEQDNRDIGKYDFVPGKIPSATRSNTQFSDIYNKLYSIQFSTKDGN